MDGAKGLVPVLAAVAARVRARVPTGALPAGGAEIPTFLSYSIEKRLSQHKEEFGHGAIEGVAGPEAANNASAAGTLVPLLALGLRHRRPQPCCSLFEANPELAWGLIASPFIGNTMLLVLNLPLAPFWAKLLHIPRPQLYACIVRFASLGVYSVNGSTVDLVILYLVGVMGFAMRRFGWPVAPAVIGVILGPFAEQQLRRALAIGEGDYGVLLDSPRAVVLFGDRRFVLLAPLVAKVARRDRDVIREAVSRVDETALH